MLGNMTSSGEGPSADEVVRASVATAEGRPTPPPFEAIGRSAVGSIEVILLRTRAPLDETRYIVELDRSVPRALTLRSMFTSSGPPRDLDDRVIREEEAVHGVPTIVVVKVDEAVRWVTAPTTGDHHRLEETLDLILVVTPKAIPFEINAYDHHGRFLGMVEISGF